MRLKDVDIYDYGCLLPKVCLFEGLKMVIFYSACMVQESLEGQKMLDFRRSLPSHKERETLIRAISQNQVLDY